MLYFTNNYDKSADFCHVLFYNKTEIEIEFRYIPLKKKFVFFCDAGIFSEVSIYKPCVFLFGFCAVKLLRRMIDFGGHAKSTHPKEERKIILTLIYSITKLIIPSTVAINLFLLEAIILSSGIIYILWICGSIRLMIIIMPLFSQTCQIIMCLSAY